MNTITYRHAAEYQRQRLRDARKQRKQQPSARSGVLWNALYHMAEIMIHSGEELKRAALST